MIVNMNVFEEAQHWEEVSERMWRVCEAYGLPVARGHFVRVGDSVDQSKLVPRWVHYLIFNHHRSKPSTLDVFITQLARHQHTLSAAHMLGGTTALMRTYNQCEWIDEQA